MTKKQHNLLFLFLSILFYILSLFNPVFSNEIASESNSQGIDFLLFGGFLIFSSPIGIIWFANILLWFAWLFRNYKIGRRASLVAFLLSACFLMVSSIPKISGCGSFLEPITCRDIQIESLEMGYAFWLSSSLIMCIGHFIKSKTLRTIQNIVIQRKSK